MQKKGMKSKHRSLNDSVRKEFRIRQHVTARVISYMNLADPEHFRSFHVYA